MDGWIKLHRTLTMHELWTSEPFTRGQAWVDLLMLANHRPGHIRKRGIRVEVERGQCGWSEVALAQRWKWSRGKVRRFLSELEQKMEQQIVQQKTNATSLITITNYGKYQSSGTVDDTADGQQTVQQTDSKRYRNKNDKNDKNEEEDKTYSATDVAAHASGNGGPCFLTRKKRKLKGKRLDTFNRFWEVFCYKRGKAEAADAWIDIPTLTEGLVDQICKSAEIEAKNRQQLITEGRSPKMAQGWITGRRWEDEDMQVYDPYAAFVKGDVT